MIKERELRVLTLREIQKSKAVKVFKDFCGAFISIIVWVSLNSIIIVARVVKKYGKQNIEKAKTRINKINEKDEN